jgi:hypothetical protein
MLDLIPCDDAATPFLRWIDAQSTLDDRFTCAACRHVDGEAKRQTMDQGRGGRAASRASQRVSELKTGSAASR